MSSKPPGWPPSAFSRLRTSPSGWLLHGRSSPGSRWDARSAAPTTRPSRRRCSPPLSTCFEPARVRSWRPTPRSSSTRPPRPCRARFPPRHDPSLPAAVDEALALRAAAARASGRGIAVADPDSVADALAGFDRVANGAPWKEAGLPRDILGAARSVLGYYQQAAQGLSDHVPGARQAETWYVQHTAAGATMRAARDQLRQQGAPQPLWYYLLPATQG